MTDNFLKAIAELPLWGEVDEANYTDDAVYQYEAVVQRARELAGEQETRTKEQKRMEQLGRYTNKRIPSFERIERLRAYAITYTDQGDLEAARDLNAQVEYWETTRRMTNKPTEPKLGGMDRQGV